MNSAEYQITIKSANQKVDDYVLDCKSTWTVQRLKQHISETHVNMPNIEDQRLIYAGNLLKDTLPLKQVFFRDSLCTELTNSSKTDFTIHLVCSTQQQKASTSQNDSNTRGLKRSPRASQSTIPTPAGQQQPTTSALPSEQRNAHPQASHSTSTTSSTNPQPPQSATSAATSTSGTSAHAREVAMTLIQSETMRQQTAIFQQLANLVAAQLVQNLANGLILNPNQVTTSSDQATQFPDILPPLGSQTLNLQTLTTTTTTTTVATHSDSHHVANSVSSPMFHAASTQPYNFPMAGEGRDATLSGLSRNEQNLNADNRENAREMVINHQVDNRLLGLGVQGAQAGVAAAVAQPPPQAPIIEQPQQAPAVDPGVPVMQHDVIDWVYYLIRAMVLMAALYIHASLFRLFFIVILLGVAYFFNRRTARRGARNQQNIVPGNEVAAARAPPGEVDGAHLADVDRAQEADRGNGEGLRRRREGPADHEVDGRNRNVNEVRENRGANRGEHGAQEVQQDLAQRPISFLKLCYLVVTDFLASLVPE